MKKKLAVAVVTAFAAATLISGCMDDAMDKSKTQKPAESQPAQQPSTTGK